MVMNTTRAGTPLSRGTSAPGTSAPPAVSECDAGDGAQPAAASARRKAGRSMRGALTRAGGWRNLLARRPPAWPPVGPVRERERPAHVSRDTASPPHFPRIPAAMRPTPVRTFALLLGLALPAAAHAQQQNAALESPRTIRFGIGGGISVPTSDYKEVVDQGYNAQAFLLVRPPGFPLSFRVTGTYNRFDQKAEVTSGFEDGYSQVAGALANATFHILLGP